MLGRRYLVRDYAAAPSELPAPRRIPSTIHASYVWHRLKDAHRGARPAVPATFSPAAPRDVVAQLPAGNSRASAFQILGPIRPWSRISPWRNFAESLAGAAYPQQDTRARREMSEALLRGRHDGLHTDMCSPLTTDVPEHYPEMETGSPRWLSWVPAPPPSSARRFWDQPPPLRGPRPQRRGSRPHGRLLPQYRPRRRNRRGGRRRRR
jgi:hypothetical protein